MRFQKFTFSILMLLFFVSSTIFAQDEKIITWKVTPQKIANNNFEVSQDRRS